MWTLNAYEQLALRRIGQRRCPRPLKLEIGGQYANIIASISPIWEISAITISRNDVPAVTRVLGTDFLRYFLGRDAAYIKTLLSSGGEIDTRTHEVLTDLSRRIVEYRNKNSIIGPLTEEDLLFIYSLRDETGNDFISHAKDYINPTELGLEQQSEMNKALAGLAARYFPYQLLKANFRENLSSFDVNFLYGSIECSEFQKSVEADIGRLLPEETRPFSGRTSKYFYTSSGMGGEFNQHELVSTILKGANLLMRIKNSVDVRCYIESAIKFKDLIVSALEGNTVQVQEAILFRGLSLPENTRINIENGHLANISEDQARIFTWHRSEHITGPKSGYFGCFVTNPFKIHYGVSPEFGKSGIGNADSWEAASLNENRKQRKDLIKKVKLAAAFATSKNQEKVCSVQKIARYAATPVPHLLEENSLSNKRGLTLDRILEDDESPKFDEWLKKLNKLNIGQLPIATDRALDSLLREDHKDGLIDVAIAFESLFGARSDIALTIASCTSRLLGKNQNERVEIFEKMKKFYSLRSDIMHANSISVCKENSVPDTFEYAIKTLINVIEILIENDDYRAIENASERVKKIINI